LLANVPAAFRPTVEPFVPNILDGLHQALSVAIGEVFLIGVGTTVVALVVAAFMRELPLRTTMGVRRPEATPGEGSPDTGDPRVGGESAAMVAPAAVLE
jgi:hypothetical protein